MPAAVALSSAAWTFGLVGVIGDALHALRDHRLDGRDLAFIVGAALALGEDHLDVGMIRRPGLGGVDHGVEEVDRELGDEPELDLVARRACRSAPRRWRSAPLRWGSGSSPRSSRRPR